MRKYLIYLYYKFKIYINIIIVNLNIILLFNAFYFKLKSIEVEGKNIKLQIVKHY